MTAHHPLTSTEVLSFHVDQVGVIIHPRHSPGKEEVENGISEWVTKTSPWASTDHRASLALGLLLFCESRRYSSPH